MRIENTQDAPSKTDIEQLKRYVRFSDDDAKRLRALRDVARPHFGRIARAFYERAREHQEAHAVFESEEQIRRLHDSQVAWLDRVLSGVYDQAYSQKSARIGRAHVRVGLPQRFMFGSMTLFRDELQAIIVQELPATADATIRSLNRILDIELGLMNGTYSDAMGERLEKVAQERAEQAIARLNNGQRAILQAIEPAAIIIIALNEREEVLFFNEVAERMTGYAADELIGRRIRETVLVEEPGTSWPEEFADAPQSSTSARPTLCTLRTRSHKLRMLDACIACIDDTDGAAIRWVIIGRDVTDLKGRELTGRRQERLAAIGTLAAGLAHEIRNPLHGAILHTRLLERGLGEKQQTELLDSARIIQQEIGRLSKLVDEFLSFARPQAIEPKPVCVKALCKHCVDLLHARAKENGIVISVDLPNNEIMAELDAPRIEQVLLNILHNAIDASAQSETQSGSRQVQLRLSREPRNARIEVSDDGDGLPNDQPIFDAFFSTKTRGTGLGLPIAHRIVSDHHGEIIAKSDSTGATFIVRLPLEHLESHVDRSDRI